MPRPSEARGLPREDVCAEYTTYDIAEMGNVVHIRQSASNQDVPCAFFRQGLTLDLHSEGYLRCDFVIRSVGSNL